MRRWVLVFWRCREYAGDARAHIPNCGTVTRTGTSGRRDTTVTVGGFRNRVAGHDCAFEVQAEDGLRRWRCRLLTAAARCLRAQRPGGTGVWPMVVVGKHWVIHFGGLSWEIRGETHAAGRHGRSGGRRRRWWWRGSCPDDAEFRGDDSRAGNGCDSTMIVDVGAMDRLTSIRRGVSFDIDVDGTPEQIAWTRQVLTMHGWRSIGTATGSSTMARSCSDFTRRRLPIRRNR